MASICVSWSQHLWHLVCDVTCCAIFIMRLWLLVHKARANVPVKLNAPDDLLSKWQNIFDPVLIINYSNDFLKLSLSPFCWLIMMITENPYFAEKLFISRRRDTIRRTAGICVCRKQKLDFLLLETPETYKVIGVNVSWYWRYPYRDELPFNW